MFLPRSTQPASGGVRRSLHQSFGLSGDSTGSQALMTQAAFEDWQSHQSPGGVGWVYWAGWRAVGPEQGSGGCTGGGGRHQLPGGDSE